MDKYIKRDDVLAQVILAKKRKDMFRRIMGLPIADVMERNTERWIFSYDHGGPNSAYFCSNCRRTIHTADLDAWSFCPSCGAKMEREGKGCTKRL